MTEQRETVADPERKPVFEPLRVPDEGFELCYECRGDRTCLVCDGSGKGLEGDRCPTCKGSRWCIICRGSGQLPEGAG